MSSFEATKQTTPGELWLAMPPERQVTYLQGMIEGLNQGLRYCSLEVAFSLTTRVSKDLTAENKLAVESLVQQMKTWGKAGVTVLKYSKPITLYADTLSAFYKQYSKYHGLSPAYLLTYMDDQHNMGPAEMFNLHEHSLHGFKH